MYDGGDVAMHFDIRFQYGDSVNTVVRNHCQGGSWGQEERGVSYFPFMPSANFDIIILCEAQAFKVGAGDTVVLRTVYKPACNVYAQCYVFITQNTNEL